MKIYAIRHSSGEWEDYTSWINDKCFSDKDKAEEFKNEYNDNLKDRVEEERIKDEKCSGLQDNGSCELNCDKCEYNNEYVNLIDEHKCTVFEMELVE